MVLEYWEPHNGFDNKLITKGLTIYTDVSFVTKNAIPANGFISVNFSGADIGNTYYSY